MKFDEKCWAICRKIPLGKVSTYKEIGLVLGSGGFRAVGNAMKKNKDKKVLCHRVINSSGFVGQYNKGIDVKVKLLKSEEVVINKNKKIDLEKYLFRFS